MEMLKGDEKLLYEEKKSERIRRLSSDIDFQYEIEQEEIHLNEREREEYSLTIISNNNDLNSTLINENGVNQSHNRSGLTRITKQTCEITVQTDPVIICKPNLHIRERVCTEDSVPHVFLHMRIKN